MHLDGFLDSLPPEEAEQFSEPTNRACGNSTDCSSGFECVDDAFTPLRGPGVVGQQPRLQPGESFEYTSGCPLTTSMGTMHGSYQMQPESGDEFDAAIGPFTLADPLSLN